MAKAAITGAFGLGFAMVAISLAIDGSEDVARGFVFMSGWFLSGAFEAIASIILKR